MSTQKKKKVLLMWILIALVAVLIGFLLWYIPKYNAKHLKEGSAFARGILKEIAFDQTEVEYFGKSAIEELDLRRWQNSLGRWWLMGKEAAESYAYSRELYARYHCRFQIENFSTDKVLYGVMVFSKKDGIWVGSDHFSIVTTKPYHVEPGTTVEYLPLLYRRATDEEEFPETISAEDADLWLRFQLTNNPWAPYYECRLVAESELESAPQP